MFFPTRKFSPIFNGAAKTDPRLLQLCIFTLIALGMTLYYKLFRQMIVDMLGPSYRRARKQGDQWANGITCWKWINL